MTKYEGAISGIISDLAYFIKLIYRFERGDHRAYTVEEVDALASLYESKSLDAFHDEICQVLQDFPELRKTFNANGENR